MKETTNGQCLCARCVRHERRLATLRRLDILTQDGAVAAGTLALLLVIGAGDFFIAMAVITLIETDGDTMWPTGFTLIANTVIVVLIMVFCTQLTRGFSRSKKRHERDLW